MSTTASPPPANTTDRIYCSGCGQGQPHGFYHLFWMYAGPALERSFSGVRLWAHYFCSHECVHTWRAGDGARPCNQEADPA